jgi:hypothetical protein
VTYAKGSLTVLKIALALPILASVDAEVPARSADVTSHLLDEMAQHTQAELAFPFGQNIINCNSCHPG